MKNPLSPIDRLLLSVVIAFSLLAVVSIIELILVLCDVKGFYLALPWALFPLVAIVVLILYIRRSLPIIDEIVNTKERVQIIGKIKTPDRKRCIVIDDSVEITQTRKTIFGSYKPIK